LEGTSAALLCAIVTDLTEQKRNHELRVAAELERTKWAEAESARQRIGKILESVTDAFFTLDREWRITDVNWRAADIYGTREELIGQVFWSVFPQNKMTEFDYQYHKAMEERIPVHFEARSRVAEDRWFDLHVYPTEEGLSIYFRDITARKETEEKLRRSEARFRNYFELGLIGMAMTSPTKRIMEVNDELGAFWVIRDRNCCRKLGWR